MSTRLIEMVENFKNMVEISLNLKDPWYVEAAEFHENEPAIHIHTYISE